MALLTLKGDESEESLKEKLRQAQEDLEAGRMSREDYETLTVQLQAQLALLGVAPTQDVNLDSQLAELDYLFEKHWMSTDEYHKRRREILGEPPEEEP